MTKTLKMEENINTSCEVTHLPKMKYSEKLKDPRWQRKRLEVMQRDNFSCQYCGDDKTSLHVHHKSYSGNPWDAESEQLITVCKDCHSILEEYKKESFNVLKIIRAKFGPHDSFYILFTREDGMRFLEIRLECNSVMIQEKHFESIKQLISL